jgi:hypothetical protein
MGHARRAELNKNVETDETTKSYARLAAAVFSIVAVLQFSRAVMGWQVMVGSHSVTVWPSWIAFFCVRRACILRI